MSSSPLARAAVGLVVLGALVAPALPAQAHSRAPMISGSDCLAKPGGVYVVAAVDTGSDDQIIGDGCAINPSSGADALAQAGITVTYKDGQPGFICAINGMHTENCPASAAFTGWYWTYYTSQGNAWVYSSLGVTASHPVPGTVEHWRWSKGEPPRMAIPTPGGSSQPATAPGSGTTPPAPGTTPSAPGTTPAASGTTPPELVEGPPTSSASSNPSSAAPAQAQKSSPVATIVTLAGLGLAGLGAGAWYWLKRRRTH